MFSFNKYLNPLPCSFGVTPTTPAELVALSHSFQPTNDLNPKIVTVYFSHIAPILAEIISHSTGVVLDKIKIAIILPIFKKGDKEDPSNYCPISFFTSLLKIP